MLLKFKFINSYMGYFLKFIVFFTFETPLVASSDLNQTSFDSLPPNKHIRLKAEQLFSNLTDKEINNIQNIALNLAIKDIQSNQEGTHAFISYLVDQDISKAIDIQVLGFLTGSAGYEKNEEKGKALNEYLVSKRLDSAILRKLDELEDYPEKSKEFLEELVKEDNPIAQAYKIEGLSKGSFGYPKKPREAKKLNELLVEQGDLDAIQRKIEGQQNEYYGYSSNDRSAMRLIDHLFDKRYPWALYHKIRGLAGGRFGYSKLPEEANKLIESLVNENNQIGIELMLEGRIKGYYGYPASPEKAEELNEKLIEAGDENAIKRKFEGLLQGEYGYKKNLAEFKKFIELLAKQHNPLALYIGAAGYKYGILGYQQDLSLFRQITDEYGIPL